LQSQNRTAINDFFFPLQKVETENNDTKLVIYCDNIDENGMMIPVTAMRMFDVSEQKPSIVEIYDYYDNGKNIYIQDLKDNYYIVH
jgi:hypothetical protein